MKNQLDASRHYLGTLCARAHDWQQTGQTRRSIKHGHCLQCVAEKSKQRKINDPVFLESARRATREAYFKKPYKRTPAQAQRQNELRRERIMTPEQRIKKNKASVRYGRKKLDTDPYFALVQRVRARFKKAIKRVLDGKPQRANRYGIDYAAIVRHIGPCPGAVSEYHIDHIRPIASFDLTDASQVALCFAPENHQWLLAIDNLKKNKY